jgi:hypothetical protein
VATIEVMAEALEATAVRIQAAGATISAVAAAVRASTADAGDPAVSSGLEALCRRLGQTVPALVRGHDSVATAVGAAASRYRSTEAGVGRLADADAAFIPVGTIGQAGVTTGASTERWNTGVVTEPRTAPA